MKLIKYLILLVFIFGAGFAVWLFYPQYQIYKIKKHAVNVQSKTNYFTYSNYYSHSTGNGLLHLALGDSVIRGYGVADNDNLVHQFSTKLDKLLPKWNLKIYEVANHFPNSLVIETTKAINSKKLNNLSSDGIHPNSAGYTAISTQMIYQFNHEYRKA